MVTVMIYVSDRLANGVCGTVVGLTTLETVYMQ